MIDLHTHILPGIDDGAKDADISIQMLKTEKEQGVDTVVLTPHFFYQNDSIERFLRRRKRALDELEIKISQLPEDEKRALPNYILGAEVAWWPNMADCDDLSALCIGDTENMLLELPVTPWNSKTIDEIYNLMGRTGITPVIAHLDRYLGIQPKSFIKEILNMGVPVQVGTDAMQFRMIRNKMIKFIKNGDVHFMASDCHNCKDRKPNMKDTFDILRKKLDESVIESLIEYADRLIMANK